MSILLFDIGATKTRLALAGKRSLVRRIVVPTPQRWITTTQEFPKYIKTLTRGQKITRAIGGLPGTLDQGGGVLLRASNLPGWKGAPVGKFLSAVFNGAKVRLENDANLAGLGEAVYGAGHKYGIVAYLGIGTGVGGTRIVQRTLDSATTGFRPGHHIIDQGSKAVCACGQHGDLESLVSGSGLQRSYGRPAEKLPDRIFRSVARHLAVGLNNVAVFGRRTSLSWVDQS